MKPIKNKLSSAILADPAAAAALCDYLGNRRAAIVADKNGSIGYKERKGFGKRDVAIGRVSANEAAASKFDLADANNPQSTALTLHE